MNGTTRLKIGDINKNLICVLCGGYLIDATTIIECLHSFCRTCIVTFLKTSRTCPVCDTVVHKTRPHQNIRSDKLLQDLVYKLVPGLYKDEMRRRREFYTLHYEAAPKRAGEERGDEMSDRFTFTEEENISLALYLCPDGGNERFGFRRVFNTKEDLKTRMDRRINESVDVRYLQCKAGVTVGLLKKFLRLKYSLSSQFQIDIFYNDEPLRNCYTLCDIAYIFNWRRRAPLVMTFCVFEGSKSTKKSVESVSCKHSTSVADQLAPTDEPRKSSDKCNMSKLLSSIDCAVPSTSTIAQPLSHLTQKKSKSSKSLLVSSTSKACPTNSSFKSNLVKDESSSSSEVTQKKNTVNCLAASTTTDTTSALNVKKSSSDKRKAETLTEASSSKKRRKNTSDGPNELLLPAESLESSSTQTQAFKSKGEASSIKVETRPVTTVGPMLSVVIACSTNAPTPSSVSQPKLFSLLNNSLSCKTSTVTISTETPPHTTCTVTPASTLGPAVTTTVHSQIVSTPASTLSTSTATLTPTTTSSSSLLFTSSPSHCSSLLTTSVSAMPTSSTVSPQTPSPLVAYPTHRVHQKIRKVNADTENQSKTKSGSLGKRPANTPIPIAPAPAKVQNYCPPSADLSRLIPLDPGLYNSVRQSSHLAKQTPVCSGSSLVYGKGKSSKSVSNKNLTPTTTTTLKFSVTSLLSSTPVKSNSLVSVAQDNKHTISTIISTGANDQKTPANLLVQALSKSKNVCRVEQFSSQMLPKSCQSVHSLQYTTTYDSTSIVSSTSVSSPTPASSASPTPAAVPPQQSQTQGSDALTKSQTSHIALKSEIHGSDITAIKSQIQGSDTAIRPQTQDPNTMIKSETVSSDTDIKPPTQESNTNLITTFKQEPGTSFVDQKVSHPASVEKSKACSKSIPNLKAASVSTSLSEKSNATKSEPEAQKVTVSKDEPITAACQRTVPSPTNVQPSPLPSVPKSSSPEYNVSPQVSTLSPTGSNNLPCPSRKQSSTQKKKIADIANTLLQNQNSKSPHQPNLSRKSVQNQPVKHVSLPLLNNEFYLGMMNGQHNGNRMGSCTESDEPLNLVKRKEVSCLPNGMYILDVPNNSQGHKKL
uniref:RING-type domain-containing protein n=1 Tax=Biomphalaria glabrata TaxID=6526 RepID=A0A2C9M9D4_BIOGL